MAAILDHESFTQPPDKKISLWRYMDLSKYAALLQRRSIVFSRADKLGDPFEGSVPQFNAEILKYIKEIRRVQPEKDPYKSTSDAELQIMFDQMSETRKKFVKITYISCWHMNEAESAGMWKLYSKSSDAVCIRTSYETLADALPSEVYMGIINYVDYKKATIKANNMFNPFLIKRLSFAHEREARAVLTDISSYKKDDSAIPFIKEVNISIDEVIKEIYVSPESPDWFRDVVAELTNKYGLTVPVLHSEMNSPPLY